MGPRIRTDVSIIEDYAIHDLYIYQALFNPEQYEVVGSLEKTFSKDIQPDTLFLTIKSNHTATFFSSWRHYKKTRKIEICCEKGTIIWEDDDVYVNSNHYKEIDGFDKFRNDGYELVEGSTEEILFTNCKTNLHLQLDDFISGVDRTQIMKDMEYFIWKIKLNLL
jgi:predicted dehydrogenase